jgi:GTP-binding protein HflX
VALPGFDKAILSDTVGFISALPTQLVAAFKATLEEVISADLIIHVRDISHPDSEAQCWDVEHVVAEIGATGEGGAPLIEAWNKIDAVDREQAERIRAEALRREDVIVISALEGHGTERLMACAAEHLRKGAKVRSIIVDATDGEAMAWLHAHGEVIEQVPDGLETRYEVRLSDADWARFEARQAEGA